MGIKLVAVIAAVVGCAMIGRSYAGGGARRARMLSEMMDALQMLRIQMLDRLIPLGQALERSSCAAFRAVGAAMCGVSAAAAWRTVKEEQTRHTKPLDCLAEADLCALDALFAGLGASGRIEQEALIAGALKSLGRLEDEARKAGREKIRLYTTLGLLAGLAVSIIFI